MKVREGGEGARKPPLPTAPSAPTWSAAVYAAAILSREHPQEVDQFALWELFVELWLESGSRATSAAIWKKLSRTQKIRFMAGNTYSFPAFQEAVTRTIAQAKAIATARRSFADV